MQSIKESTNTPAKGIPKLQKLSPQELDAFFIRLYGAKYNTYKTSPFLGNILQRLKVVATYDVPTMGVDNFGNIYINPSFAMSMTFEECVGVLAHETMHIATLTFHRQKGRDMQIWNIATDFIMNRDLLKSGFKLPKGGCIAENDIVTIEGKNGQPVQINIAEATAEWLYSQFLKHAKPSNGPGQSGPGGGLPQPFDKMIGDGEGKTPTPIEGSDAPGNKNNHQIKNDVLTASEAAKQQEKSEEKDRGTGVGGLRESILEHIRPKVNWRQILKNIVAKTVSEYDMKRPAKRQMAGGYYAPRTITYDALAPICIAIDTSGSITQKELTVFVTETVNIFRIYKKATITIILWHTEAYYDITITQGNVNSVLGEINKHIHYDGTTMSSVVPYLQKKGIDKKVKAVVYLTDGFVEDKPALLPPPCKNFALVTDNGGLKGLRKTPNLTCYPVDIE